MPNNTPIINSIRDAYWEYVKLTMKEPTYLALGRLTNFSLLDELHTCNTYFSDNSFMGMKIITGRKQNFIKVY